MENKKNKIRNKRKRKNARNQYTCTKRIVLSEQNNDTATTAELSSPTVTQISRETEDDISDLNQSESFQKLSKSVVNLVDIETNEDNFFFLMNFCILKSLINQICVCRSCNGEYLEIYKTDKKGLSLQFSTECNDCDWIFKLFSSPEFKFQEKYSNGQKSYEVGRDGEAMKTFTTMINMPKPLAIASFNDINNNLHQTYIDTVLQSMKSAANEVQMSIEPGASECDIVDCQVSVDGSWHKRRHSSINGYVSQVQYPQKIKKLLTIKFSQSSAKGA